MVINLFMDLLSLETGRRLFTLRVVVTLIPWLLEEIETLSLGVLMCSKTWPAVTRLDDLSH